MERVNRFRLGLLLLLFAGGAFFFIRGFSKDTKKLSGEKLYRNNCATCHGINRQGRPPTFPSLIDIQKRKSREAVRRQIRNGKNIMPAFTYLSDKEVEAIISYLFGEGNPKVEITPLPLEKRGEMIFKANCTTCHQATVNDPVPQRFSWRFPLRPAPLAGATRRFSKAEFFRILNVGPMFMPSFSYLSQEEKEALWEYAKTLEGKGEPTGPTIMQMYFRMMGRGHRGMMDMMGMGHGMGMMGGRRTP